MYIVGKKRDLEIKKLKKEAVRIDRQRDGVTLGMDTLLKEMLEVSAKGIPVKSDFEGRDFVIRADSSSFEAKYEWKEQACKPWLRENFKPEFLAERIEKAAGHTRMDDSVKSFQEAAVVEVLLFEHPECADKITMLQLLNASNKISLQYEDKYNQIAEALVKSTQKFIDGEEVFPPTLENVVALNRERDSLYFSLGRRVDGSALEQRIAETEIKMLENCDLSGAGREDLVAGLEIARKHKDECDFKKVEKWITAKMMMLNKTEGKNFLD